LKLQIIHQETDGYRSQHRELESSALPLIILAPHILSGISTGQHQLKFTLKRANLKVRRVTSRNRSTPKPERGGSKIQQQFTPESRRTVHPPPPTFIQTRRKQQITECRRKYILELNSSKSKPNGTPDPQDSVIWTALKILPGSLSHFTRTTPTDPRLRLYVSLVVSQFSCPPPNHQHSFDDNLRLSIRSLSAV
jgi:hypothetical protein